jgi:hypothetical protein
MLPTIITKADVMENPIAYPVRVLAGGEIHNGRIKGVQNRFPYVQLESVLGCPSFEFSWQAILNHLNFVTPYLRA